MTWNNNVFLALRNVSWWTWWYSEWSSRPTALPSGSPLWFTVVWLWLLFLPALRHIIGRNTTPLMPDPLTFDLFEQSLNSPPERQEKPKAWYIASAQTKDFNTKPFYQTRVSQSGWELQGERGEKTCLESHRLPRCGVVNYGSNLCSRKGQGFCHFNTVYEG